MPNPLLTPSDVLDPSPGCPSCGSQWGHPGLAHGAPGDRSITGLLCSVAQVARLLVGTDHDLVGHVALPAEAAGLLDWALACYRGEAV